MSTVPPDFQPHFRKSPATDPWEPLFSRRRENAVELFFTVRQAHCNSRGFLHGGVIAALCDNAMGLSLGTVLDNENTNIITLSLSLDYIGIAGIAAAVLIEPRVIRAGASIGFCDALVRCADKTIARANATFSIRMVEGKA
jgi:uncharacterized protein (TIGR00369 family)